MSSVRRRHGRLFQIRGPAAPKLLSPKLLCVRSTTHNYQTKTEGIVGCLRRRDGYHQPGTCIWPHNAWRTWQASLNSTRRRTGSQCSWHSTGVMWSRRLAPVMRRAAAFCSNWTLLIIGSVLGAETAVVWQYRSQTGLGLGLYLSWVETWVAKLATQVLSRLKSS